MIQIIADSTCDLSRELVERYHLDILPLSTIMGEDIRTDGVDVTPEELYAWSDAQKATPKTAVFSQELAVEKLRPYLEEGMELLCFCISESMSGSGQVMRLAAEELGAADRVHVVDSASLSTGISLQILLAADLISGDADMQTVLSALAKVRDQVRASFVVDTMTYLYRGGRCSGTVAMAGNMLKIHPRIVVEHGAMKADKKYRGSILHALKQYVTDLTPELMKARPDRVFITHSGCSREAEDMVRTYLERLHHFKEILITRAGSVVSSHCGPNTLGVLFIAGDDAES